MATAKQLFIARTLAEKYGVTGKVAGLYVMAGYSVDIADMPSPSMFLAYRGGDRILVKVLWGSASIDESVLEELEVMAKERGARPAIIIYGKRPKITSLILSRLKERGFVYKRVRP